MDERILVLITEQFKEFRKDLKKDLSDVETSVRELNSCMIKTNEKQIRMAEVCLHREKELNEHKAAIERLNNDVGPIKAIVNVKNAIIAFLAFIILVAGAISASKAIANHLWLPTIERSAK